MPATALILAAFLSAPPGHPPGVREANLRLELLRRERADQKARTRFEELDRKPGGADPDAAKRERQRAVADCRAIDQDNTARLKEVVDRYGWPGKSLVGTDGAAAAWLLAQHADLDVPFQGRCLGLLTEAVKAGEATPLQLAYLTDRVRVNEKRDQVYGTQFRLVGGRLEPHPIEDGANVDRRRRDAGLPPLAEYLKTAELLFKPGGGK